MTPRPLIAGNWKMFGLQAARAEAQNLAKALGSSALKKLDVLVCPPATLLADLSRDFDGSGVATGGQDCHTGEMGAHTGDVSAVMIKDAGGAYVLAGHSERRADHGETDALVRAKAEAARAAGLAAIICVGESETQRDAGEAFSVVEGQLKLSLPVGAAASGVVVAYEPVWAIGTGRTPTLDDIAEMHARIRARLIKCLGPEVSAATRVLYGGSVKPGNAEAILSVDGVDGALVGGASLRADDFHGIIAAAERVYN